MNATVRPSIARQEDAFLIHRPGIFAGRSTLLLGKIGSGNGREVSVKAGDVIVLPAGTAHSNLESSPDYRYIGVYPKVSLPVKFMLR